VEEMQQEIPKLAEEQQGKKIHEFLEMVVNLVGPLLWPDDQMDRVHECLEKFVMEKLHSK
jgi:hypothetical protein